MILAPITVSRSSCPSKYRLEFPIGTVLYETSGRINQVRVSPDGGRVAFVDHPRNIMEYHRAPLSRFSERIVRRDGRVVDGGGLENHCVRKGTGGSNPSPSANLRQTLATLAAPVGRPIHATCSLRSRLRLAGQPANRISRALCEGCETFESSRYRASDRSVQPTPPLSPHPRPTMAARTFDVSPDTTLTSQYAVLNGKPVPSTVAPVK